MRREYKTEPKASFPDGGFQHGGYKFKPVFFSITPHPAEMHEQGLKRMGHKTHVLWGAVSVPEYIASKKRFVKKDIAAWIVYSGGKR